MQQVGKGTDLPQRLIDRRIDIIEEFLCIAVIAHRAPQPHHVQAGGNQMLASRIVQIGCNPLLHLFLKRQQPALEFCCSLSFGRLDDSIDGRPLFERPMATDQLDYIPAFGITDGIDRRIKLALASAEGKAAPVTNRSSLGQTCVAKSADGLRVLFAQAILNFSFAVGLKFRASARRPDSCSRRKNVRH